MGTCQDQEVVNNVERERIKFATRRADLRRVANPFVDLKELPPSHFHGVPGRVLTNQRCNMFGNPYERLLQETKGEMVALNGYQYVPKSE
eukprot:TRINITY_DN9218_c0_g1_i1.p1 TRINITY_DN9218_c0_g1~~TRINITY_DN9218_c0_g1_i1.p1  ORF type:complete len:100 (-),score=17.04 TRINITY_DN9218_c0_g1_i1:61-330(-)